MTDLHYKAILAGLFFGIWPILMNRSGLPGNVSSAAFSLGVAVIVLPFALRQAYTVSFSPVWLMVIGACVTGALGILFFNGMLSKTTPETVGTLFVLMIVVQVSVPAVNQIIMNGELTLKTGAGFAAAIIAAFLLA